MVATYRSVAVNCRDFRFIKILLRNSNELACYFSLFLSSFFCFFFWTLLSLHRCHPFYHRDHYFLMHLFFRSQNHFPPSIFRDASISRETKNFVLRVFSHVRLIVYSFCFFFASLIRVLIFSPLFLSFSTRL